MCVARECMGGLLIRRIGLGRREQGEAVRVGVHSVFQ